ncbi:PAS domain-containing sensor histidine kinase [Vibrio quintilis]|nr:PAS domain S-box protein [Vibrio quintilis]
MTNYFSLDLLNRYIDRLHQENHLLRTLIEHTREPAIFVVDPEKNFQFVLVNRAFCHHLHTTPETIYQKTPADIDIRFTRDALPDYLDYLKQHKTNAFESEHLLPDGSTIPVEVITNYFEFEGRDLIVGYFLDISSRKQNEKLRCHLQTRKAREKAERQYKAVFDHLDDEIYLLALTPAQKLKIIDINRAALSHLGKAESECIGTYFESYLCSDSLHLYRKTKQKCIASGQACHFEELCEAPKAFYDISLTPLKNEAGQIDRLVLIRRDITEKKIQEAEKLIRDQEFRVLVENSWDAIVRYDTRCRRIYANPAFLKIVNAQSIEEIRGRTPLNNPLSGADSTMLYQQIMNVIQTGQSSKLDIIWTKDGTESCYEAHLIPEFCPDNTLLSVLCIGRDYSRRWRAETALQKREEEFRTLVENSPDTITRHALDGRRIYMNPTSIRVAGELSGKMLHTTPLVYPGGTEGEHYQHQILEVARRGEGNEFEFNQQTQAGYRCSLISLVPEVNGKGEIVSVLAIGRDITLLKQVSQELEQSRTQLRSLIAHREINRENERKHIAREVHDELGQQLTALKMAVQSLDVRYSSSVPELKPHLSRIQGQLKDTISFTRNLVSRLRPGVLDMGFIAALEWLADDFRYRTDSQCYLTVNCSQLCLGEEVETAVFRIVQESLTNIIKHAQATRVDMILEQTGTDFLLTIRDNGCGFDTQKQFRESFGLVGIRERVNMIHAELNLSSTEGEGTSIALKIPINHKR